MAVVREKEGDCSGLRMGIFLVFWLGFSGEFCAFTFGRDEEGSFCSEPATRVGMGRAGGLKVVLQVVAVSGRSVKVALQRQAPDGGVGQSSGSKCAEVECRLLGAVVRGGECRG